MSPPPSDDVRILYAASKGDLEKLRDIAAKMGDLESFRQKCQILHDAADGWTPLHKAAGFGWINICKFFIEELTLDIDIKTEYGSTSLLLAIQHNHVHTAKYLIKHNANIAICDPKGLTSLHYATMNDNKELMQLLILKGADIDADSLCGTPLAATIDQTVDGNVKSVKFLLARGATPNAISHFTDSPLKLAITLRAFKCFELLLKAGADPNLRSRGTTPLVQIAKEGGSKYLGPLLQAGADPNQVDMFGVAPIEYAASARKHKVLRALFPVTRRIQAYPDWSIQGLMERVQFIWDQRQIGEQMISKFQEFKGRGNRAMTRGDFREAIIWYTEAVHLNVFGDASLLLSRSKCFSKLNELGFALLDAMTCVRLQPDWAQAHYRQGRAWWKLKIYIQAARAFQKASMLDPKDEKIYNALNKSLAVQ